MLSFSFFNNWFGEMRIIVLAILISFLNFCNLEKVSITNQGGISNSERKIILEIGNRKVSLGMWKSYLNSMTPDEEMGNDILSKLFDEFIEREMIYTYALEIGFQIKDMEYKKFLGKLGLDDTKENRETFIVANFIREEIKNKIFISQEELKKYYGEHYSEFRQKKLYHIKEIVVNNKELAQEIHSELMKNGVLRFGNFAREYSISPSAINGGDLGYFSRNQLPPEFEKIIFSLRPGKISKVIRTKYGYHIFYLEEVIGEHQLKFYEVKGKIDSILRERREKMMYNNLLKKLRRKYKIKVINKNLNFNYKGNFSM